jgi:hypothetical protein
MGYALPGGRGGGLWWAALCTAAAFAAGHAGGLPVLRAPRALPAVVASAGVKPVQLWFRDGDGQWRVCRASARGRWATAPAAAWARAVPGFRAVVAGGGVRLVEQGGGERLPFFVAPDGGRLAVWAGTPHGLRVRVATTPILTGTLSPGDLGRLRQGVRVASVASAWDLLSRLGG